MQQKKPFELEFVFKASPTILYNFLSTPSGLSQWFADSVDVQDEVYIFTWSGSEEIAKCVEAVENESIKFIPENAENGEFLEFRISKSEVTGDTILTITDFAADYEVQDQKQLWENQVAELQMRIGG